MSSDKTDNSANGAVLRQRKSIAGLGADAELLQKKAEDQLLLQKSKLPDKP